MNSFSRRLCALAAAVACITVASGSYATTSTINPAVPAQNSPLSSATLRSNFQAAYNDITALWAAVASATGISALTGDVTCSGTGSVACTLTNSPSTRSNLGLGTAAAPTFAGAQLTKNVTALPAAQSGTVLQLANTDGTAGRVEVDAFGAAGHFTVVDFGGTAASPSALAASTTAPIGSLNVWGYNGTAVVGPQAAVRAFASQNWSSGSTGTSLDFAVTPNGSSTLTPAMVIGNDGGVTIGSPTGGDKGAGTVNATGLYLNGTLVSTSTGGGGSGSVTLGSITTANPSISGDLTSGFYSSAAAKVDVAISGVRNTEWGAGTVSVTGDATITGNTSDGSALTLTSANTSSTQIVITNTTSGGHSIEFGTTGSGGFPVGQFFVYDNTLGGTAGNILNIGANLIKLGSSAGSSTITSIADVFIGKSVGSTNVSGTGDIIVGTASTVDVPTSTTSNYMNLANLLVGDVSKGILIFRGPTTVISACGTSPSLTSGSNDMDGEVVAGSSTTSCTVGFANTHGSAPKCVVSPQASTAGFGYSTSTTALTVVATALGGVTFDYHCFGASTANNPVP